MTSAGPRDCGSMNETLPPASEVETTVRPFVASVLNFPRMMHSRMDLGVVLLAFA